MDLLEGRLLPGLEVGLPAPEHHPVAAGVRHAKVRPVHVTPKGQGSVSLLLGPSAAANLARSLTSAVISMAAFGWSLGWAPDRLGPGSSPGAAQAAWALSIVVGAIWIVSALPG